MLNELNKKVKKGNHLDRQSDDEGLAVHYQTAILISKSNNLYRQKKRFNRWQNRDRQSVLDGCNFSYSVIMRVMTFLVGVLKSASSIKMRIADQVNNPTSAYFWLIYHPKNFYALKNKL